MVQQTMLPHHVFLFLFYYIGRRHMRQAKRKCICRQKAYISFNVKKYLTTIYCYLTSNKYQNSVIKGLKGAFLMKKRRKCNFFVLYK